MSAYLTVLLTHQHRFVGCRGVCSTGRQYAIVHSEPGCIRYVMHEAVDSTDFVFVEEWASEDALETHMSAPSLTRIGAALDGKLAKPLAITRLLAIEAGEKGSLQL